MLVLRFLLVFIPKTPDDIRPEEPCFVNKLHQWAFHSLLLFRSEYSLMLASKLEQQPRISQLSNSGTSLSSRSRMSKCSLKCWGLSSTTIAWVFIHCMFTRVLCFRYVAPLSFGSCTHTIRILQWQFSSFVCQLKMFGFSKLCQSGEFNVAFCLSLFTQHHFCDQLRPLPQFKLENFTIPSSYVGFCFCVYQRFQLFGHRDDLKKLLEHLLVLPSTTSTWGLFSSVRAQLQTFLITQRTASVKKTAIDIDMYLNSM